MSNHNYPTSSICAECKGRCCKNLPGSWYPKDFQIGTGDMENAKETILNALLSGMAAVDWYEGYKTEEEEAAETDDDWTFGRNGYYLRPPTVGVSKRFDPSWGGTCVFLTDTGCSFSFESRPQGCRALEPLPDSQCDAHGHDKLHAARAWEPFYDLIEEIRKELWYRDD